jgi:hypothetical protein
MTPRRPKLALCSVCVLLLHLAVAAARAQCNPQWLARGAIPGAGGPVNAIAVLADGDLVAAGEFPAAGGVLANNVARWDGAEWSPLGSGLTGSGTRTYANAAVTLTDGSIVLGGYFDAAGGVAARYIARWDGAAWSALGAGLPDVPYALAVLPDGDVVAGGWNFLVRWNGSTWAPMITTVGPVYALTLLPNGDLVAAGANFVGRWDGAAWSSLPSPNEAVFALAVLRNGDLAAAGRFTTIGGVAAGHVARWNGSAWSPLGPGLGFGTYFDPVLALAALPDGGLVAGGEFDSSGGESVGYMARWNGSAWTPLASGADDYVNTLTVLPQGDVVAGGFFDAAGGVGADGIARWDGTSWSALGAGLNSKVYALTTLADGDLVAGGAFISAPGGQAPGGIARWNGTGWSGLSTGMLGGRGCDVEALAVLPSGDLVAGGYFTSAGGVPANNIARWDGSAWAPLGTGMNGSVSALALLNSGDLVAGGAFTTAGGVTVNGIARWDGAQWQPLGSGVDGAANIVFALAVLPNGDLVAGGAFRTAGGVNVGFGIARWDGAAWHALSSGVDGGPVYALAVLHSGDLVAGGEFSTAGGGSANAAARWNGVAWSPLGLGLRGTQAEYYLGDVYALTVLPDGDLVAGGHFVTAGTVPANSVARWDGASWFAYGAGVSASTGQGSGVPAVRALKYLGDGDLAVGGAFAAAGATSADFVALWGCPGCYANCDGSTNTPILNINDFVCFLQRFAAADPYANCDGSTTPPVLNVNDFVCFLQRFAGGCP